MSEFGQHHFDLSFDRKKCYRSFKRFVLTTDLETNNAIFVNKPSKSLTDMLDIRMKKDCSFERKWIVLLK